MKQEKAIRSMDETQFCIYCRQPITEISVEKEHQNYHDSCATDMNIYQQLMKEAGTSTLKQLLVQKLAHVKYNNKQEIVSLVISNCGLVTIPEAIFRLQHLETLDVSHNQLERIDPRLFKIPNLKQLSLAHNDISDYQNPDFLIPTDSCIIEHLDVSFNQYIILPSNFESLKQLKVLNIHGCEFEQLPSVIQKLQNLEELSFTDFYESTPKWFINMVLEGLKVYATSDQPDQPQQLRPFYLRAQIWLGYFKQGDDLHQNMVNDANGTMDVVSTLQNHQQQMQHVTKHLAEIANVIKSYPDAYIDLYGDTHFIGISGDYRIIKDLVNKELAQLDYFWDD